MHVAYVRESISQSDSVGEQIRVGVSPKCLNLSVFCKPVPTHTHTHNLHTKNAIGKVITRLTSPHNPPLFSTFDLFPFCMKNNEDVITHTSNKFGVIVMSVGGFVL